MIDRVRRKAGVQRLGSGDEQFHSGSSQQPVRFLEIRRRYFQGKQTIDVLSVDVQHFPAGRQNGRARALPHDRRDQVCRGFDDVFAIVENQKKVLSVDGASNRFGRNRLAAELQPKRPGDRRRNELRIGQRRQLDQPSAIVELGEAVARDSMARTVFPIPLAPVSVTTR